MSKYQPEEIHQSFKYAIPLQVRFSDIDGYMHVNNGVYFNYMEHARANYLHKVCGWDATKIGAVVANVNLDFYQPIHFLDEPTAYVRCTRLGSSSFTLEQVLMGKKQEGHEVIFAKATITMVSVDIRSMMPSPLPEAYRTKIQQHEGLVG
ncbi:MAG TPA: acyl-CoA thioesterase [Cyclobacteriaceae bacterium]|nr:acyl-CoA thioesterase [Cyclobacteriaceae bacterium]